VIGVLPWHGLLCQETVSQSLRSSKTLLGIKAGETTSDGSLFTIESHPLHGRPALWLQPFSINGKVYPQMTVDKVAPLIEEYRHMEVKA
jgi:NADH:ubiquinone oxidoreductase subunit E